MKSITLIRRGGGVRRYHTEPTIRQQNVAEHSWGVAQLVAEVYPNASSTLLLAALNHDVAEYYTGDIPAPVKWECPGIREYLDPIERRFWADVGGEYALTNHEYQILKWCDSAELVLWCLEEEDMGNRTVRPMIVRVLQLIKESGHPTEEAEMVYRYLLRRAMGDEGDRYDTTPTDTTG